MYRKTAAYIDLQAIRDNYSVANALAPKSRNIAVIKADAYGHGLVPVAETLQDIAPAFAVATIDEALELRSARISLPVLVLEGANSIEACERAAVNEFWLAVHCTEQISYLLAAKRSSVVPLWIKVDSGMHRLGFATDALKTAIDRLRCHDCNIAVICTQLACADFVTSDVTARQLAVFDDCSAGLGLPRSIGNSAGILAWPDSHADWNRPGYMLYGNSPLHQDVEAAHGLRPAMSLRSEIMAIREIAAGESVGYGACWTARVPSTIGTVAVGYADGYPRHAPNGTPTMVNGKVAPLVGTVSMDMIGIDLSYHDNVAIGDSVELWGRSISVNEVASLSATSGYELLTGIAARVQKHY